MDRHAVCALRLTFKNRGSHLLGVLVHQKRVIERLFPQFFRFLRRSAPHRPPIRPTSAFRARSPRYTPLTSAPLSSISRGPRVPRLTPLPFPSLLPAREATRNPRGTHYAPNHLRFHALRTSVSTFRRALRRRPRRFPRGFPAGLRRIFPRGNRLRPEFLADFRGTARRFGLRDGDPRDFRDVGDFRGTARRFMGFLVSRGETGGFCEGLCGERELGERWKWWKRRWTRAGAAGCGAFPRPAWRRRGRRARAGRRERARRLRGIEGGKNKDTVENVGVERVDAVGGSGTRSGGGRRGGKGGDGAGQRGGGRRLMG